MLNSLTAGGVDEIRIRLRFSNINEDAFRPVLSFDLTPFVFFGPVITGVSTCLIFCLCCCHNALFVPQLSLPSSCIGTHINGTDRFTCSGFPNPLQQSALV